MPTPTREIQLARRPRGAPVPDDFRMVQTELPDPRPGEVLVRNLVMSVDPYMRRRMDDAPSYLPPWELDRPLSGGAVGVVEASEDPDRPIGSLVLHDGGWREHAVLAGRNTRAVRPPRELGLSGAAEPSGAGPPGMSASSAAGLTSGGLLVPGGPSTSVYLGVLGMPGLTAYAGLFRIAEFRAGDRVFVSAAAGAVGSLVGQFARLRGAERVLGSAGSSGKVSHVVADLGYDAAFDYHDGPVRRRLLEVAPDGLDVCFDNVGGEQLEAAIGAMRRHGRIALCGAISLYNATTSQAGPRNLALAIGNRLTIRGFIVLDHEDLLAEFTESVGGWLRAGQLQFRETVVEGLDAAVSAFIGLLTGANTGKMVVRLAPDPD